MSVVKEPRLLEFLDVARRAAEAAARVSKNRYHRWRVRRAPRYPSPTAANLVQIEQDLCALGIRVVDYSANKKEFERFKAAGYFPANYSDPPATKYVRVDCVGVRSSRKYDAHTFTD